MPFITLVHQDMLHTSIMSLTLLPWHIRAFNLRLQYKGSERWAGCLCPLYPQLRELGHWRGCRAWSPLPFFLGLAETLQHQCTRHAHPLWNEHMQQILKNNIYESYVTILYVFVFISSPIHFIHFPQNTNVLQCVYAEVHCSLGSFSKVSSGREYCCLGWCRK